MRKTQPKLILPILGLVLALLVLIGMGVFRENTENIKGDVQQTGGAAEEENRFMLQTNPNSAPIPSDNVSSSSGDIVPAAEGNYGKEELENIRIYERLNYGVVNITTEIVAYNWFLEPVPREGSSGSGAIIDKRGYILTNHHVVKDAYTVKLTLADGSRYEGEVIGTDPENDLAVVKFDPGDAELTTIPMGTSKNLRVGQKVLAIGNPFAFDRTLTTGIVSGLGRPVKNSEGLIVREMIQTDASINPGNSGGPLLNSRGEMIGINTMIYSPSGGSVGIGFAVPVDTARRVVPELIEYGSVRRGWIDIVPVQIFPQLADYADLPVKRGILVSRVLPGGNADEAGLRGGDRDKAVRYGRSVIYLGGDIIIEIDGDRVTSLSDLYNALEDNKPGEVIDVVVVRGRKEKTIELELSERPQQYRWD